MANPVTSYLQLTCFMTVLTQLYGIRVDFNTNHGPIIPPTTTQRPVPQPPFRNPAPVWEDQSNDIPNPSPYNYVPPPPSRPRYNSVNIFDINNSIEATNPRQHNVPTNAYNSQIISHPNQLPQSRIGDSSSYSNYVPSLSVQYIPNIGLKYYAVVPAADKVQHITTNQVNYDDKYYNKYDKSNGKYNAKLKKYKAYEQYKQQQQQQQQPQKHVPYYNMYYSVPKQQIVYSSLPVINISNNNNNNRDQNNNNQNLVSNKQ